MEWVDVDFPLTESLTKHKVSEEVLQNIKKDFLSFDERK